MILRSRLNHRFRAGSRHLTWIGVAAFLLAACGGSGPSGQHASSPSPDQMTQRYVALVHSYWIAYKTAEGDVPTFARICGYAQVSEVDPPACRTRIAAILPQHEKFLSDLDTVPAPSKFAADDRASGLNSRWQLGISKRRWPQQTRETLSR
jgi:hypothetical protein